MIALSQLQCRLVLTLTCFWLVSLPLVGCSRRASTPREREQQAINTLKGRSWFDSQNVAYLPPPVSEEFDDDMRTKGWPAPPESLQPTPGRAPLVNWSGIGDGMAIVVWVILALGLVALAVALGAVSMKSWDRSKLASKRSLQIQIDPTRVADLPFEAVEEMRDPLERSRQLANAGDYNGAILFLYGYKLLALDRAGKLVLHRGKTNRMYLMELGGERRLRELLSPTVEAFEEVYFGKYALDRARFMSLWKSVDEFHQILAAVMAAQTAVQQSEAQATSPAPGTQEVSKI